MAASRRTYFPLTRAEGLPHGRPQRAPVKRTREQTLSRRSWVVALRQIEGLPLGRPQRALREGVPGKDFITLQLPVRALTGECFPWNKGMPRGRFDSRPSVSWATDPVPRTEAQPCSLGHRRFNRGSVLTGPWLAGNMLSVPRPEDQPPPVPTKEAQPGSLEAAELPCSLQRSRVSRAKTLSPEKRLSRAHWGCGAAILS